jgi:heme/copper-type cytochrome/quinol oxidase subunit 2
LLFDNCKETVRSRTISYQFIVMIVLVFIYYFLMKYNWGRRDNQAERNLQKNLKAKKLYEILCAIYELFNNYIVYRFPLSNCTKWCKLN